MEKDNLNASLAYLGNKLDNISNTLKDSQSGYSGNLGDISKSFTVLRNEIKSVVTAINDNSEISTDYLNQLISRVVDLQDYQASVELKTYEGELKDIYSCLEDIKSCLETYTSREIAEKEDLTPQVIEALEIISSGIGKIKPVDLKAVEKSLKDVEKAVKAVEIPEVDVDFTPTNKLLTEIRKNIPQTKGIETYLAFMYTNLYACLEEVKTYSKDILLELRKEKEFKLNDLQFRQLRQASTTVIGGSIGGGGMIQANRVGLTNVSMPLANTEYSHTFSPGTVSWQIRIRDTDVPLLVAYTTGKLPTSGDGLAYFTVPAYFIEKNTGLDWSGKILYVQTASASQYLEVIEYKA